MKTIEKCSSAMVSWVEFLKLLTESKEILLRLRTRGELRVVDKKEGQIHFFGDLHGDEIGVQKLREIVSKMDEDETICLGSLGDIVAGGGKFQLEALCLFLSAIVVHPNRTFVCKGNCEVDRMILAAEGFPLEVYERWGQEALSGCVEQVVEVLDLLPTWLSFPHMNLLVVHGGPIRPVESLESLELLIPLLDQWGDYDEVKTWVHGTPVGPRGVDYSRTFGANRVRYVLEKTCHRVLLRGHQSKLLKRVECGVVIHCDSSMATLHTCHKAPSRHLLVADMGVKIDSFDESNFVEI